MLVDLDFEHIRRAAAVVGPYILLAEAHAVKRLRRQAVAHLRKLLRVRKRAAVALDDAGLAADVIGRAHVAERIGLDHAHALPRPELRLRHALRPPASAARARCSSGRRVESGSARAR